MNEEEKANAIEQYNATYGYNWELKCTRCKKRYVYSFHKSKPIQSPKCYHCDSREFEESSGRFLEVYKFLKEE